MINIQNYIEYMILKIILIKLLKLIKITIQMMQQIYHFFRLLKKIQIISLAIFTKKIKNLIIKKINIILLIRNQFIGLKDVVR